MVVGVINYCYAFALIRLLRPADYADFAAGQALLLTVGTIAAVSVPWVLAQELVRCRQDADGRRRVVWFATLTNLAQGLLAAAATGVIASTFAPAGATWAVAVGALLIFLSSTSLGWLQGAQRFRLIAVRGLVEVVTKATTGLVLVSAGAGAAAALGGFAAGATVVLAGGAWLMREDYRQVSGALRSRHLWRSTRGVAGVQGLVSLLASVDIVLVAVLPVPAASAASYQASMVLARIPLFLAGAVAAVAFPMLGDSGAADTVLLRSGSRLYLFVAVPLALALATAPPELLAPLFPAAYDRVGDLLPLTALAGVLIGHVELLTTFFQARRAYDAAMRRQAAGIAVTLLGVPVAWQMWGVVGIAVAACCGVATTVGLLLAETARQWPGSRPCTWRQAAGAVALGLVLLALRAQPVLWLSAANTALVVCAWAALRPSGSAP